MEATAEMFAEAKGILVQRFDQLCQLFGQVSDEAAEDGVAEELEETEALLYELVEKGAFLPA